MGEAKQNTVKQEQAKQRFESWNRSEEEGSLWNLKRMYMSMYLLYICCGLAGGEVADLLSRRVATIVTAAIDYAVLSMQIDGRAGYDGDQVEATTGCCRAWIGNPTSPPPSSGGVLAGNHGSGAALDWQLPPLGNFLARKKRKGAHCRLCWNPPRVLRTVE